MILFVGIRPLVLLVPSMAAAVELPRRVASTGRALTGLYPFKLRDLARALAEPALLGAGLRAWDTGHDALVAARLLEQGGAQALSLSPELPRAPIAGALARTLSSLRLAGIEPSRVGSLVDRPGNGPEDEARLRAVAELYRRFVEAIEGRFADPVTLLRAASRRVGDATWLREAEVLVADELELEPEEQEFLAALARAVPVRRIGRVGPPGLRAGSFAAWAEGAGIASVAATDTVLAPVHRTAGAPPEGLRRLRETLFEPPEGERARDGSVELVTAPGENAEVRAVVRRLLAHAARGVPWEEMAVILPRPQEYALLFTDLLQRLEIPHRLHPSLPLSRGRSARSLLLLLRCRDLPRKTVMEFLTFAPVPFTELLGEDAVPRPAQWDALSRDAGIVSGRERWNIGLRATAETERAGAGAEEEDGRRQRRLARANEAEALWRVVERLSTTLDGLSGEATWPEWSARLADAFSQWIGRGEHTERLEHQKVAEVIADLAGLTFLQPRAAWRDVQAVLETRLEWERMPLEPSPAGALHVGSMDAMAGVPFRVVAMPGLVEGGFPGVIRPDPFLLDAEREALAAPPPPPAAAKRSRQLSLFDEPEPPRGARPSTSQDRLLEARRSFHRALGQATEQLLLSYPRADPRSGRERMPSLFFVAAAATREGRPLSAAELDALVQEDTLDALTLEQALDRSERDRIRVRAGGREAALAIAAGSVFFKQSHLASEARWSKHLTAYDGLILPLAAELARKLDPVTSDRPISASKLATWSRCGFQYLLQYVLGLQPALEPEERKRLDPLERGNAFHQAAERFLRELRQRGELPVRDTPETQERLLAHADRALDDLVASSPPRFTVLWARERERFRKGMLAWLAREADSAHRATPAWFEVSFGLSRDRAEGEPHLLEPLEVDLGDGRRLRVSGKIDRIDRRPDGTLVLRDYKTGRAPRDDGGMFRGGKQLQIPFYILAAARMFPEQPVVEAFLDYVDGGRQVGLDPEKVRGDEFKALLRGVVDAIGQGVFAQEHTSCDWCDYTAVCGPKGLLERRRRYKLSDPRLQRVLRLKDVG